MDRIKILKYLIKDFITRYEFSNRDYFTKKNLKSFEHNTVLNNIFKKKYGICMELNYTFSHVLKKNGFQNYLVKCYKPRSGGRFYDIYHLGIILQLDNKKYFIDVGFGEHFTEPVEINPQVTTNKISVDVVSNNFNLKIYDVYVGEEYILRIMDEPIDNIEDIDENYQKFFNASPERFPLCRVVYDRIYDPMINKFVIPHEKSNL
uniref:N-acetyltransferase n=1 Tax=Borely moumouvirus TaxID=2712067 RepID=A0A6G6AAF9_9VIRU